MNGMCFFLFFWPLNTLLYQNGISQIFRISITLHHWWWGAALLNSHWTCRFCFSTPRVPFSEMLYWIFYRWESENWVTSEKKCQKCFKFFLLLTGQFNLNIYLIDWINQKRNAIRDLSGCRIIFLFDLSRDIGHLVRNIQEGKERERKGH